MHEGVGGGHFSVDITIQKIWLLNIGGQCFTRMLWTIGNPMVIANGWAIWSTPLWLNCSQCFLSSLLQNGALIS
jgi:hypothetical protein